MTLSVFFDLDGTLTDPKVGITASIQFALERLGQEAPEQEDLLWCIGPPLLESLAQLVGRPRAQQALDLYRARFAKVGWAENAVYPGVPEALGALQEAGLRLYVATSKPVLYARRIIDHFELGSFFQDIFGSELDGTRADKSELLKFALAATSPAETATMVGDREHDVVGALNNGLDFIGVTYGYGSPDELRRAGAKRLAGRPDELVSLLR